MGKKTLKVSYATEEQQKRINKLFRDEKFVTLKKYLEANDLLDEDIQSRLIYRVLMKKPNQLIKIIGECQLSENDIKNIAQHSNVGNFQFALYELEEYRQPILAVAILTQPDVCDVFEKLQIVIQADACSENFWDVMLEQKLYGLLGKAVQILSEKKKLPEYQRMLGVLQAKIIKRNVECELTRVAPSLDVKAWKMLDVTQVEVCSKYVCPPEEFFYWCVDEKQVEKLTLLAQKYSFKPDVFARIITTDAFEVFAAVIKLPKQQLYSEVKKLLFNRKYKKFRKEYLKYHNIPLWEKLSYFLS